MIHILFEIKSIYPTKMLTFILYMSIEKFKIFFLAYSYLVELHKSMFSPFKIFLNINRESKGPSD